MSSSQLIQSLIPESGGSTAADSNRRSVESFLASGTITAGDLVVVDTAKTGSDRVLYVAQSAATAGLPTVIGVALDSVTAGQIVRVVTGGYVAVANIHDAVAAGEAVCSGGVTAGRGIKYASGTHTNCAPFGVALGDASASHVAPLWVYKRF